MKNWDQYKKLIVVVVQVIAIAILSCLFGAMFTMQDKMTELGNQLSYLIDTNNILQSQVSNLQSNIETALEEEASLVEKQSIEVVSTDFSKGTYEVKISVIPKEYSDATKVSVFFGANEIPLTLNRFSYEGIAELSVSNNYDGNVTFLFVNGDKKNTEIIKDYQSLQTKLEDLLYGAIPKIPQYKDGKISFSDEISYTLNAYENYGYETLELVLLLNDENAVVVNLLEDVSKEGNAEDSDEIKETDSKLIYGMSGSYDFTKSLEVEDGQRVCLRLRSKCENGYTLEYDLFSGVVQKDGPNGFEETEDYFVPNYCVYDSHGNKFEMK